LASTALLRLIFTTIRWLAGHGSFAYMDVGKGREQDAEALLHGSY